MAKKTSTPKASKKKKAAPKTKPLPKNAQGVTLLSGGNPQIPKGDGRAPVQAYLDALPEWKQGVGVHVDALVRRLVPEVRMAVRWNTPFYGIEGQGWFLSFHCMTRYVKVALHNGSELEPPLPVTSKHPRVRYVHLHEDDPLEDEPLASWIRQAAELPGDPVF